MLERTENHEEKKSTRRGEKYRGNEPRLIYFLHAPKRGKMSL